MDDGRLPSILTFNISDDPLLRPVPRRAEGRQPESVSRCKSLPIVKHFAIRPNNTQQNPTEEKVHENSSAPSLIRAAEGEQNDEFNHIYNNNPIRTMHFDVLMNDQTVQINPHEIGFIPSSGWQDTPMTFGMLVTNFFRKRNSSHCKFMHKLYNALRLGDRRPEFVTHVGIQWVTNDIILVNRENFARLLGVKTVEGGLFHQQGNFPSHGFVELTFEESKEIGAKIGLGKIDLSVIRFIRHSKGKFLMSSREDDIERCQWKHSG